MGKTLADFKWLIELLTSRNRYAHGMDIDNATEIEVVIIKTKDKQYAPVIVNKEGFIKALKMINIELIQKEDVFYYHLT